MKSKNTGRGIGFVGLLQVAFIVLKLCGVIKWAWFWVLTPMWVDIVLFVVLVLVIGGVRKQ